MKEKIACTATCRVCNLTTFGHWRDEDDVPTTETRPCPRCREEANHLEEMMGVVVEYEQVFDIKPAQAHTARQEVMEEHVRHSILA